MNGLKGVAARVVFLALREEVIGEAPDHRGDVAEIARDAGRDATGELESLSHLDLALQTKTLAGIPYSRHEAGAGRGDALLGAVPMPGRSDVLQAEDPREASM